jgi:hypothetical protein
MRRYLDNVVVARDKTESFASLMGKSTLQGLFESLIVLKVHGYSTTDNTFQMEPGNLLAGIAPRLTPTTQKSWKLRIDLIPTEDYLPDPTGRNLYEIHRVERDYVDVLEMAEAGIYDMKVVEQLDLDYSKEQKDARLARHRGQNETKNAVKRRRVCLEEMWGTILDEEGIPIHKNVVMTVANDKYIIRQPTPNPFWHGESPIIAAPIIAIPHSVWGKAFYDHTSMLNIVINELVNLIIDGGISSVWGIREVRADMLEDPKQITNGLPQNATLVIKADAPIDAQAVKASVAGKVPPEAMAVLNLITREHDASAMTNDTRMGFLPQRQVKATEIQSADQSHSMLLDSFAGDLEKNVIEPTLRKSWLTILQHADDLDKEEVIDAIGVEAAFAMSRMGKAARFAMFATGMNFRASGLSATLGKARDFQKLMALMQSVQSNPILTESFLRRFDGDVALDTLVRSLNINPESYEMDEAAKAEASERTARMGQIAQVMPQGGTPSAASGGGPSVQSQIAQDAEPSGGLGT